jgi:hypothetical protein
MHHSIVKRKLRKAFADINAGRYERIAGTFAATPLPTGATEIRRMRARTAKPDGGGVGVALEGGNELLHERSGLARQQLVLMVAGDETDVRASGRRG